MWLLAWFWCGFDVLAGGGGVILVAKWFKVSFGKMVKKWLENLVMEIILFNTKNKRVPKIRLLLVVKKSALRLERVNLANFL
ncbi:hypothetical protein UNSWCS_241 [Campylobacter concisus UNSWCS]|uniref:Uncharacterized protein n=3 Tax=root TaxID=1 RepID=U2FIQ4_9BACT|nr:hypothetical protein UNSWCS_241 [Campylobacter concisus UNSWCS]